MNNPFFKNHGPFKIFDLLKDLKIDSVKLDNDEIVRDIKDLSSAEKDHLTFFHSKKYYSEAAKTKASYCITLKSLSNYLPNECKAICVDNVLLVIAKITSNTVKMF